MRKGPRERGERAPARHGIPQRTATVQMYRELVRDVNMARAEILKMETGFDALQAESQVAWMRGRVS